MFGQTYKAGDEVLVCALGAAAVIEVDHDNVVVVELVGMDGVPGDRIEVVSQELVQRPNGTGMWLPDYVDYLEGLMGHGPAGPR